MPNTDHKTPQEINIRGLDKAEVLAALYNNAKMKGLGFLAGVGAPPTMTVDKARDFIGHGDRGGLYFDYLNGRVMKVDLKGDLLWTPAYDRDNGQGAALEALRPLLDRSSKDEWLKEVNPVMYDPNFTPPSKKGGA